MGVSGQRHAPAALYPRGKDPRYPLDRRLGGPQSRSGRRHHTGWATAAPYLCLILILSLFLYLGGETLCVTPCCQIVTVSLPTYVCSGSNPNYSRVPRIYTPGNKVYTLTLPSLKLVPLISHRNLFYESRRKGENNKQFIETSNNWLAFLFKT
jgi:hypothetical protein